MLSWQTSGRLYDEAGNALEVKRAFANVPDETTDQYLIDAVAGKKLRILWVVLGAGGSATPITFGSGDDTATALSSTLTPGANQIAVLPFNPFGWFETIAGQGLSVTTGSGSTTGILVGYVEVP